MYCTSRGSSHVWTVVLGWCVELMVMGEDSGARVREHKRRIRCEPPASSAAPSLAALRPVTGGDRVRAASPSLSWNAAGPKRENGGMRLAAGVDERPSSACLAHIRAPLLPAAPFSAICTEVPVLQTQPPPTRSKGSRPLLACQRRIMRQPEWLSRSTTQI